MHLVYLINYIQLYHYCSLKVDILVSVKISGQNQTADQIFFPLWKKACGCPCLHNETFLYQQMTILELRDMAGLFHSSGTFKYLQNGLYENVSIHTSQVSDGTAVMKSG